MRSDYRIDDLQKTYFVIDSFEELFDATKPDFAPVYAEVKKQPLIADGALDPVDRIISKGKLHAA
jgi:phenylalanine-4-hydroxylase